MYPLKADTYTNVTQLYKPWGEVRYSSGTLPTDYILPYTQDRLYTGQYSHTDDFGLMYYVARWYDPVLGRMAQADSIVPGAGNPMAWDRYAGMMNNPVKYSDPSGHCVTMANTGPGGSCGAGGGGSSGPVYGSGGGAVPNGFSLYGTGAQAGSQMKGVIIRFGLPVAIDYTLNKLAGREYTTNDAIIATLFSLVGGKAVSLSTELVAKIPLSAGRKYIALLAAETSGLMLFNSLERAASGGTNNWDTFKLDFAVSGGTAVLGYHFSNSDLAMYLEDEWGNSLPIIQSDTYGNLVNSIADALNPSNGDSNTNGGGCGTNNNVY